MVNGDGRAWHINDPDRFWARFRVVKQMKNIGNLGRIGATPADVLEYAKKFPVEGQKLNKLQTQQQISCGSGVVGLLGSSAIAWRWSRTPLLVVLTAGFGAVAGALASDDVASLALGTFKFDNHKAIEDFYVWLHKRDGRELPPN